MAFAQAKQILKAGLSPLNMLKLLVITAGTSHSRFMTLCLFLLRPFTRDGEIVIRYPCYGRTYLAYVRVSDLASDRQSLHELAIAKVYPIETRFAPDLIIDGGGNTGQFTLLAAAAFPNAKIVTCEPVPRNLAQIRKHLARNRVTAELQPVCIGGRPSRIPFYIREANRGSFEPDVPFSSQIEVDVVTLAALVEGHDAARILIKLDIEGMEFEVLDAFVPAENRPVMVVGEVHKVKTGAAELERIFEGKGWSVCFDRIEETTANFVAWSPAAVPILADSRLAS